MKKQIKPLLFIKKGKIVNQNGDIITPEIGNEEHIELTKKYNNAIEYGISKYDIEAKLDVEVKFDCLCGNNISCDKDYISVVVDRNGLIDTDITYEIKGAKTTCPNCKQKYKVAVDKDGYPVIMLICEQDKQQVIKS